MKRILLVGAVLSIAVYAAVAQSATPPSATERKLLKDVAALKTQVKALKKSVTDAQTLAVGIGVIGACNTATCVGQASWKGLLRPADARQRRHWRRPDLFDDRRASLFGAAADDRSLQLPARALPDSTQALNASIDSAHAGPPCCAGSWKEFAGAIVHGLNGGARPTLNGPTARVNATTRQPSATGPAFDLNLVGRVALSRRAAGRRGNARIVARSSCQESGLQRNQRHYGSHYSFEELPVNTRAYCSTLKLSIIPLSWCSAM
jgi:hypothetical protein